MELSLRRATEQVLHGTFVLSKAEKLHPKIGPWLLSRPAELFTMPSTSLQSIAWWGSRVDSQKRKTFVVSAII